MSNRPPATYKIRVTAIPSTLTQIAQRGPRHLLQGILFETSGVFASTPSDVPDGVTPAVLTQAIPSPMFIEDAPISIDPSTTALPLVLYYGPPTRGAQ